MGSDYVYFNTADLPKENPDKAYQFTIGFLPFVKTIFWKRWHLIMYLTVLAVSINAIGQGFVF